MDLALTYAGMVYDRTRALYDGEIRAEGIDLRYLRTGVEELFWRQGRYAEFDAAEFSLGAYLAGVEDPDRPFDAIPVFPSRAFRHSAIYVRADSPIVSPRDLAGGSVGTPEWSMTASLWMRGILGDHYDLDLTGLRWRTGGLEQAGRQEKSRVRPPERFSVDPLATGETLTGQLVAGELDAVITARPPRRFLAGDGSLRRLFTDPKAEELRYFQTSGIVPIMHVVVLRRALLREHPWIANNLRMAFEAARAGALSQLRDGAVCSSSLVWEADYAEEEVALLGDAFAYGVEANAAALEAVLRYAHDQGFTAKPLEPADVFVPATLTDAKI
jgi:4,5-dihydroxyphthalate decarboxylase